MDAGTLENEMRALRRFHSFAPNQGRPPVPAAFGGFCVSSPQLSVVCLLTGLVLSFPWILFLCAQDEDGQMRPVTRMKNRVIEKRSWFSGPSNDE